MNIKELQALSDEEVAALNEKLSNQLAKEIIRGMIWTVLVHLVAHFAFKRILKNT